MKETIDDDIFVFQVKNLNLSGATFWESKKRKLNSEITISSTVIVQISETTLWPRISSSLVWKNQVYPATYKKFKIFLFS